MATTVFEYESGEREQVLCPSYVSDEEIDLSPNAVKVLEKRYLRRDQDGKLLETPAGMFYRVAYHVAKADERYGRSESEIGNLAKTFYDLMVERRFYPNSPTFTGAATPLGQLAACFVLGLKDDMGKDPEGIFSTLRTAALIQQTGGGNGFSFSRLRPKGDVVQASNGKASGPVGFLRVYDAAFLEVSQGGVRRGANMAVLRVDHPDIEEFITCKAEEGKITNFNISVGVTDEFMEAVKAGASFALRNPRDGKVWRTVNAQELFDKIVEYAHRNGEPGVLFIDTANRSNPVPHLYELEATNPCGEQYLGPYENCCLGSINLAVHFKVEDDGRPSVDWEKLKASVRNSTRFLDNVVDANAYVPAIPQIREAALRSRRIGLGVMGLGDLFYQLGVRYGSPQSLDLSSKIMEFVRYHAMRTSIDLAAERGPFPALRGSIYDTGSFAWTPPVSIHAPTFTWGMPDLDWTLIVDSLRRHGIRNAAQTTIAPTGTIATVCGCEGYGCEPVFALGYVRHFKDGDKDVELVYTSPLFEQALDATYLPDERKQEIKQHVATYGTCQDILDLPESIRHTFVVSSDISAEEHVRMQAALQAFVDNSLSKTINFPPSATRQDVADAYKLAWQLGCKGITVYVAGSREQVVLETKATQQAKVAGAPLQISEVSQTLVAQPAPRSRPSVLAGTTYRKETPLGKAYVTVNNDKDGQPFEVFLNVGKAGSDVSAVSEAMGRLISLALRMPSGIPPTDRLAWVIEELREIGGSRPLGFGPNRVRSLPDGVAQALTEHLYKDLEKEPDAVSTEFRQIGDICPECGEATFLNIEGCRKCAACGYSEC